MSDTAVTKGDEVALLKEAHVALRSQIAHLTGRVQKLENSVGATSGYIGLGGQESLRDQVKALREQMWHDGDAKKAIDQMRKLSYAISEIFAEEESTD